MLCVVVVVVVVRIFFSVVKEVAVVCRLSFVAKSFVVCREVICRLSRSRSSSFVAVCREVVRRRSLLFRRSSSSFVVVCRSLSSFAIVVRRYAVCRRLSSFVVCRRRRLSSFVVCRRCLRRLLSLIVNVVDVVVHRDVNITAILVVGDAVWKRRRGLLIVGVPIRTSCC